MPVTEWRRRRHVFCSVALGASRTRLVPAGPLVSILRVAAASAYVQQRGGGDFTDPFRGRPGFPAWCVSATASGRHPPMAVEVVLQVAVLQPPSGSNVAWCAPACCVRSVTVYGGGGRSLPRGCGTAALSTAGASQFDRSCSACLVIRQWWPQFRGGVCWWAARWVERFRLSRAVVFLGSGEIPVFLTPTQ